MKARTIDIFTKLKFAFTKPVLFVRSDKEEYSDFSTFLEITYTIIISVLFIFRLFMYNPATPISGYLFMFPLSILIAKLSIWSGAGIYTYFLNLGSTQKVSYLYIRRTLIPVSYTPLFGRQTGETVPDGVSKAYAYDASSNRTAFTLQQNGSVLQSASYTYNQLDQLRCV